MTQIIEGRKTEFAIDPAILNLLPEQGSIELQHDAAGKVHRFHTHPGQKEAQAERWRRQHGDRGHRDPPT